VAPSETPDANLPRMEKPLAFFGPFRIGSSGISNMPASPSSTSRSLAMKWAACSRGNRSRLFFPIKSLRSYPKSSSPARLNITKRRSVASLRKIMSGTFSTTDSMSAFDSFSSSSACLRSVDLPDADKIRRSVTENDLSPDAFHPNAPTRHRIQLVFRKKSHFTGLDRFDIFCCFLKGSG